jgi:hypothetical protein
MAYHLRRQIREAVASAVTGLATTGAHVYQSTVYPLEDANLPALLVLAETETTLQLTMHGPGTLQRSLAVDVIAIAKATADLDDTLDQIAKEVEIALAPPVTALTGLAKSIGPPQTEITLVGSADKPVGRMRLRYEVEYFTADNAPDVAL